MTALRRLQAFVFALCLVIATLRPAFGQGASTGEVLTNQLVVQMVAGKLPKELILEKIRSTPNNFDLTSMGLVNLNSSKVPKDIIKAMMMAGNAGAFPSPTPPPPPPASEARPELTPTKAPPRDDRSAPTPESRAPRAPPSLSQIPTEPGIYLYADGGRGPTFLQLEPTVYSAGKTGGSLGTALSYGIAKTKMKAVVRGAQASIRTSDRMAEFYFVFEQKSASLSNSNAAFAGLSSPNEFQLVRFNVKAGSREVVVGAMNAYSSQTGTDDKADVPYTSTKLRPGVYRVLTNNALGPGEFAFLSAGGAPVQAMGGAAGAQRLFDFGVRE